MSSTSPQIIRDREPRGFCTVRYAFGLTGWNGLLLTPPDPGVTRRIDKLTVSHLTNPGAIYSWWLMANNLMPGAPSVAYIAMKLIGVNGSHQYEGPWYMTAEDNDHLYFVPFFATTKHVWLTAHYVEY